MQKSKQLNLLLLLGTAKLISQITYANPIFAPSTLNR